MMCIMECHMIRNPDPNNSSALLLVGSRSLEKNAHRVAIVDLPSAVMFQDVSQLFVIREQDISDLVLVQNILRIFNLDQIEIITKHAFILKNIDAAVDENLHVSFIQGQVTTPHEII